MTCFEIFFIQTVTQHSKEKSEHTYYLLELREASLIDIKNL